MFDIKSILKRERGFTLVELLVVIGILGILAAGLLATIDPLEQLRKGSDSNYKQAAVELKTALDRYYAVRGTFPWRLTTPPANCGNPAALAPSDPTFAGCVTELITAGELKSTFATQTTILSRLRVTDTTVGDDIRAAICFDPESKAESRAPQTNNDTSGNQNCDNTADTTCNWCTQ